MEISEESHEIRSPDAEEAAIYRRGRMRRCSSEIFRVLGVLARDFFKNFSFLGLLVKGFFPEPRF